MSLTTNNTSLQEILAKVNALPEAGGGGDTGVTVGKAFLVNGDGEIKFSMV